MNIAIDFLLGIANQTPHIHQISDRWFEVPSGEMLLRHIVEISDKHDMEDTTVRGLRIISSNGRSVLDQMPIAEATSMYFWNRDEPQTSPDEESKLDREIRYVNDGSISGFEKHYLNFLRDTAMNAYANGRDKTGRIAVYQVVDLISSVIQKVGDQRVKFRLVRAGLYDLRLMSQAACENEIEGGFGFSGLESIARNLQPQRDEDLVEEIVDSVSEIIIGQATSGVLSLSIAMNVGLFGLDLGQFPTSHQRLMIAMGDAAQKLKISSGNKDGDNRPSVYRGLVSSIRQQRANGLNPNLEQAIATIKKVLLDLDEPEWPADGSSMF